MAPVMAENPTSQPTSNPTLPPVPVPTSQPVTPPTPSQCIICDDRETPSMADKGKDCSTQPNTIDKKCNKNNNWMKKKWCQLSCYNAGNGYPGDVCCDDSPTNSPTASPVSSPTPEPTVDECIICDDVETPSMADKGKDCSTSLSALNKRCNKNDNWTKKGFCRLSCYNSGNGYPGDVCCNGSNQSRNLRNGHH